MKAITIAQPWAWAIVEGAKRIENRTWRTKHRGPLAIHAGKSKLFMIPKLPDGTDVPQLYLPFGALVGVAELVDCVRVEDLPPALAMNPFAAGPWCWILDNVRKIEPIPMNGAQLLWTVPDGVLPAI